MHQRLARRTLSILMLLACDAAIADAGGEPDDRIYLGVAAGEPMTGRFEGGWNFHSDTPYAIHAGWKLSRHWTVEARYTDLGKTIALERTPGDLLLVDGHVLDTGVHYRHPVGRRLELTAGLGVFDLHEEGRLANILLDPPPPGYGPVDNDQRGVYAELGGRLHFNGLIALRAAYRWYDFDSGHDGSPWLGIEFGF